MILQRYLVVFLLYGIAIIPSIQSQEDVDFARDIVLNGAREMSEFLRRVYVLAKMITEKDVGSSDYEFNLQNLNGYEKIAHEILDGLDLNLKSLNAALLDLLKIRREELLENESTQTYTESSSDDPESEVSEVDLSYDPVTKMYTSRSGYISSDVHETEIYAEPSSDVTEADLSYNPETLTYTIASDSTSREAEKTGIYTGALSEETVPESEVVKANLSYDPLTRSYTFESDQTSSKVDATDESLSNTMREYDFLNEIPSDGTEDSVLKYIMSAFSNKTSNNEGTLNKESPYENIQEFVMDIGEAIALIGVLKKIEDTLVKAEEKEYEESLEKVLKDYVSTEALEDGATSSDATNIEDFNLVLEQRSGRLSGSYDSPLSIPVSGIRGKDYPDYTRIPETLFTCTDKEYIPGMYADIDTDCQVFHVCFRGGMKSLLCPIGTIFNQRMLSCDYWYNSACSLSPRHYYKNEEIRGNQWDDQSMSDEYDMQDPEETSFLGEHMKFLPVRVKTTRYTNDQYDYPEHDRSPYHSRYPSESRYPPSESRYPRSNPPGIESLAHKIFDGLFGESKRAAAPYDRDYATRRRQPREAESVPELSRKEDRSGLLPDKLQNSVSGELPDVPDKIFTASETQLPNAHTNLFPSGEEIHSNKDKKFVHLKNKSKLADSTVAAKIVAEMIKATDNVVTKGIMPLTKEILAASYSKRHKKQKL